MNNKKAEKKGKVYLIFKFVATQIKAVCEINILKKLNVSNGSWSFFFA